MRVIERVLALSKQLTQAIESGQDELVGTLLAERQQLLKSLGTVLQEGSVRPQERDALQAADVALCRAAQGVRDRVAQELEASQRMQVTQRIQARAAVRYTAPVASFLDQLG